MKPTLLVLAALLLPGCAAPGNSSEREWQRAQCGQIIDKDAQEKCVKRVESEYGKK